MFNVLGIQLLIIVTIKIFKVLRIAICEGVCRRPTYASEDYVWCGGLSASSLLKRRWNQRDSDDFVC